MDELYIGLISGTSMDAVDAALVAFEPSHRPRILAVCSTPLSQSLVTQLRSIGPQSPLASVARADVEVADAFASTTHALLTASNHRAEQIRAIGSHGQTVWHAADASPPLTVQIGDPNRLAERTGIAVVADFRRRDMAAGGQGAPLACGLHAACFRRIGVNTVVLNLGGIANITLLPGEPSAEIGGFDCGPANTLLDAWYRHHCMGQYDTDGIWAAGGHLDRALLDELASDAYFQRRAPKSTGPEYFNLDWLAQRTGGTLARLNPQDVQTTLTELTALTAAQAIQQSLHATSEVLICGGGAHNRYLLRRLCANLSGSRVRSTAEFGLDPDFVEAVAFAWLAQRRLCELPGNQPSVTGAHRTVVLGGVYSGRS